MNVRDLLRELLIDFDEDDLRSGLTPDTEVRLATQEHWPFEHEVNNAHLITTATPYLPDEQVEAMSDDDREKYEDDCGNGIYDDEDKCEKVFYIVEGRQTRYLPTNVRTEVGWS